MAFALMAQEENAELLESYLASGVRRMAELDALITAGWGNIRQDKIPLDWRTRRPTVADVETEDFEQPQLELVPAAELTFVDEPADLPGPEAEIATFLPPNPPRQRFASAWVIPQHPGNAPTPLETPMQAFLL